MEQQDIVNERGYLISMPIP